jgi:hypothetical protein
MQDFQGGRARVGFRAFEVAGSWFPTRVGGTWHPGGWSAFKGVAKLAGGGLPAPSFVCSSPSSTFGTPPSLAPFSAWVIGPIYPVFAAVLLSPGDVVSTVAVGHRVVVVWAGWRLSNPVTCR